MSSDWINIRFGSRHLQIGPNEISFNVNWYWVENKPTKWFEIYKFFGYSG